MLSEQGDAVTSMKPRGEGVVNDLTSKGGLLRSMPELRNFSAGLLVLAEVAPERLTLAQATFFLLAGLSDLSGKPATFTELREAIGPLVNRSLHTTYKALVEEGRNRDGKREPGLGWLRRELDPEDNRKKYLHLTAKGRKVLREIITALRHTGGIQ